MFLSRFTFRILTFFMLCLRSCNFFSSRSAVQQSKPGVPIQISVTSEDMATAVDQKLLRQTKFPPEFSQKVDVKKVNIEVMKK